MSKVNILYISSCLKKQNGQSNYERKKLQNNNKTISTDTATAANTTTTTVTHFLLSNPTFDVNSFLQGSIVSCANLTKEHSIYEFYKFLKKVMQKAITTKTNVARYIIHDNRKERNKETGRG